MYDWSVIKQFKTRTVVAEVKDENGNVIFRLPMKRLPVVEILDYYAIFEGMKDANDRSFIFQRKNIDKIIGWISKCIMDAAIEDGETLSYSDVREFVTTNIFSLIGSFFEVNGGGVSLNMADDEVKERLEMMDERTDTSE
jgi:hypothetical protein